jgi:acetyl-CoA carboxylase biotin carboxyl carrier protein
MDLSDVDVTDILALIDSLPYDELDLRTGRFRLILRRTPDGWTRSTKVLSALDALDPAPPDPRAVESMAHWVGSSRTNGTSTQSAGHVAGASGETGEEEAGLVAVRAPLPGTFYRAPRPGAAPFVEVGSQGQRGHRDRDRGDHEADEFGARGCRRHGRRILPG